MRENYQSVPCKFEDEDQMREAIDRGERAFLEQLKQVSDRLLSDSNLSAMTLCGPSCSGKTTLCLRLTERLNRSGRRAKLISVDDFFKDREELNRKAAHFGGKIDYDSADALDLPELARCVEEIAEKGETVLPIYSLHTGKREGFRKLIREPGDLLIFEGIQTLYPEFTRLMDCLPHLSVFTHVGIGYDACGTRFSPREIRLLRRLVRDFHYRNSPPAFTFYLWQSVTENEDRNIFPNSNKADLTVNTALPYELSAIKEDLLQILSRIPKESEYAERGESIAAQFAGIDPINRDMIPHDSIFREFMALQG